MTKYTPKRPKGTSSWVNSRVQTQNKKLVRESNAASRSRGLIKARLTALTAKVSILESQIDEIHNWINSAGPDIQVVEDRKEIQKKLLLAAEILGEEE